MKERRKSPQGLDEPGDRSCSKAVKSAGYISIKVWKIIYLLFSKYVVSREEYSIDI